MRSMSTCVSSVTVVTVMVYGDSHVAARAIASSYHIDSDSRSQLHVLV